jgi:hypothetical protein
VICLVGEFELFENMEALIVFAGIVADAATIFVAALSIPLEIKAQVVADYASNLMNSSLSSLASFIIFKSKPTPMFSLA